MVKPKGITNPLNQFQNCMCVCQDYWWLADFAANLGFENSGCGCACYEETVNSDMEWAAVQVP